MTEIAAHTPGPWEAKNRPGAGWQIDGTLPPGFKFDGTARGADGKTEFMLWTLRQSMTIQIADERWVQFETGPWAEMQKANARLIAAAPKLLAAARVALDALMSADPGNPADETGWAHDESRDAWVALRDAVALATGCP